MATGSTTLVVSSRVASSLFGVMETNYWSRLSEIERNLCFGHVSHLVCQGKTAWNIAGCLEQHWRLDLSAKVAEICNNPKNIKRIHRRHPHHRPNIVTDMYLFGYVGRQSEAFPAIVVMSANGSIAKRLASLLSRHESLMLPGFNVLHLEVKVELLAGRIDQQAWLNAIQSTSSVSGELARDDLDDTNRTNLEHFESQFHSDVVSDGDFHENVIVDEGEAFRYDRSFVQARYYDSQSRSSSPLSSIFDYPESQSTYSNRTRFSTFGPWKARLDGESLQDARLPNTFASRSLCGSRVVTSALPSDPSSSWHQCTIGGIVSLRGKLYGMTVAHPFYEPAAFLGHDSSSSSMPSSDSGQDEDFESDSQDDGEMVLHSTPSISHSSFEIYLEDFESPKKNQLFPTAASFSRLGATSVLSTIGTFTADQSSASKYWSSELDWALLEITEQQLMTPNVVSTTYGVITPSSVKKKQDLVEARVVVASGVSGIIYAKVYSTVAQIILPSSTKMREVWKIDCVCAPGDCGAWVICPDTGAIYGIVVAASPGLQITYILPAELVFEDLMARWNMDLSQTQELFLLEPERPLLKPSRPSETVSAQDPTQSCLSHLSQLFAQIKITGFAECKTFIENQPRILQEDANLFLREAVRAHRRGDSHYARLCVHRGLLIRKCSYRTHEERGRLLQNLASGKISTVSDFLDDLDDSFEAMISKADQLEPPEATSRTQPAPFQSTRQANASQQVLTMRQYSSYPHGSDDQLSPLPPFQNQQIRQGSSYTFAQEQFMDPTRERQFGALTAARTSQHGRSNRGSRNSTQSDIEIKGTAGDTDCLDSRYRRQQDPAAFFVVGKVFAILWHENVGLSNKEPGPEVERVNTLRDNNSIGRYGERVFSHIRRMVVVRRQYGYCWCIAINTYSGKGGSYKRISTEEERSHTIVYDCTKKPQLVAGERGFNKEPIAVIMTPPETLHVASRLNYAKVHTVEHNVKVMDVGMVHPSSMPYFRAHWENEIREK